MIGQDAVRLAVIRQGAVRLAVIRQGADRLAVTGQDTVKLAVIKQGAVRLAVTGQDTVTVGQAVCDVAMWRSFHSFLLLLCLRHARSSLLSTLNLLLLPIQLGR